MEKNRYHEGRYNSTVRYISGRLPLVLLCPFVERFIHQPKASAHIPIHVGIRGLSRLKQNVHRLTHVFSGQSCVRTYTVDHARLTSKCQGQEEDGLRHITFGCYVHLIDLKIGTGYIL